MRVALGDRVNKPELCTAGFLVTRGQVPPGEDAVGLLECFCGLAEN